MLDLPFLPSLFAEFEASHYSCLVIEYCPGGDLLTVSQRQRRLRFSIPSHLLIKFQCVLVCDDAIYGEFICVSNSNSPIYFPFFSESNRLMLKKTNLL